jgi:hypothetical protein
LLSPLANVPQHADFFLNRRVVAAALQHPQLASYERWIGLWPAQQQQQQQQQVAS